MYHEDIEFSPNPGEKLLRTTSDRITVWECTTGRQLFQKLYNSCEASAKFSPDGKHIALICGSHILQLICAKDGTVIHSWNEIDMGTKCEIKFFPKGIKFTVSNSASIHLFDEDIHHQLEIEHSSLSISPDGQKIVLIHKTTIDIFDSMLQERLICYELNVQDALPYPVPYRWLWVHSTLLFIESNTLSFHHFPCHSQLQSSNLDIYPVKKLSLSPNSHHLVTVHENGSICLWDVKSGHQIQLLNHADQDFPQDIHIDYSSDSFYAIFWNEVQLMVLHIPSGFIQSSTSIHPSRQNILDLSLFPDSNRILIVEANGNISTWSLQNMTQNYILPLPSPLKVIRQLVISPKENLVAICGDMELIVHGINENIHHTPLASTKLRGAGFSPNDAHVYIMEIASGNLLISRVDISDWTVHPVYVMGIHGEPDPTLSFVDTIRGDGWAAMRLAMYDGFDYGHNLIDLSSGKFINPPSLHLHNTVLEYEGRWIMDSPIDRNHKWTGCMTQDHLAYIEEGRAIILDFSSLITQACSVKDLSGWSEVWRWYWLWDLKDQFPNYFHEINIGLIRSYGSLEHILTMIEDGDEGTALREEVRTLLSDEHRLRVLNQLWEDEELDSRVEEYFRGANNKDVE